MTRAALARRTGSCLYTSHSISGGQENSARANKHAAKQTAQAPGQEGGRDARTFRNSGPRASTLPAVALCRAFLLARANLGPSDASCRLRVVARSLHWRPLRPADNFTFVVFGSFMALDAGVCWPGSARPTCCGALMMSYKMHRGCGMDGSFRCLCWPTCHW